MPGISVYHSFTYNGDEVWNALAANAKHASSMNKVNIPFKDAVQATDL